MQAHVPGFPITKQINNLDLAVRNAPRRFEVTIDENDNGWGGEFIYKVNRFWELRKH